MTVRVTHLWKGHLETFVLLFEDFGELEKHPMFMVMVMFTFTDHTLALLS